jgi:glycosyltransferase involved in cell wall biosynthesis
VNPQARTLRIAAHVATHVVGGAERRSIDLLARLARRGHDVVLYCNDVKVAEHARSARIAVELRPLRGDLVMQDALRFARRLQQQKPDVLLIITFRRTWLAAFAARIARVPRVVVRIGLSSDIARSFKYRFVLHRWIDDVVLNAQSLEAPFRSSLRKRSRAHVAVIPNGVPFPHAAISSEDARVRLGVPSHAFVVGTIARLVHQKRIDRLLDAVALLDNVHVLIAGDGARRDELRQHAARLGIEARAHFVGHTDDTASVLGALDVFVVASDKEGMSNAMLEALAAGVPVVSTPVSGAEEALLGAKPCGIVVDRKPEAIAAAIDSLRASPAQRALFAEAALAVVKERYSSEVMTDAWEGLLLSSPAEQAG